MGARAGAGAGAETRTEAGTGAGAETGIRVQTGAQASKTALKILCKSSSEYLGILIAAGTLATRGFTPEGPAG